MKYLWMLVLGATLVACEKPVAHGPNCDTHSDCPEGRACDPAIGQCTNLCDEHSECADDRVCGTQGYCVAFVTDCNRNEDCADGTFCDVRYCRRTFELGYFCNRGNQCLSGHCVAGLCCNSDCDGTCEACAYADTGITDGRCSPIPAGDDPANECAAGIACDGAGACFAKAVGEACGGDYECLSGDCAGVCVQCGDGVVTGPETCDDGNAVDDANGCDSNCQANSHCGDGQWEVLYEECDDGNLVDETPAEDGCNALCEVEHAWGCDGSPSTCFPVRFVNAAATGAGTGMSWEDAYTDLATALGYPARVELWVAAGTYKPGTTRDATFTLRDNVQVYGGFAGTETKREQRDPAVNVTILSGELGDSSLRFDNIRHVVTVASGATLKTVLDGFTVEDGYQEVIDSSGGGILALGRAVIRSCHVRDNYAFEAGGGIAAHKTIELSDSLIENNATDGQGGGLHLAGTEPSVVRDTVFKGNVSFYDGGGLYLSASGGGSFLCERCTFTGNIATLEQGGGAFIAGAAPSTFRATTFVDNRSEDEGGGVYVETTGTVTIEDVEFLTNRSVHAKGGALAVNAGEVTVRLATFLGNSADLGGGALLLRDNTRIDRSMFFANETDGDGGAIYADVAVPQVSNSIFYNNEAASEGGVIYSNAASPVFTNCTMALNTAVTAGGAFYNHATVGSSHAEVKNTIVWSNTAAGLPSSYTNDGGSSFTERGSCIEGHTGVNDVDPLYVDITSGDLRLSATSPVINGGNNTFLTEAMTLDLAGNPRIADGTVDIGAYEYQP